MAANLIPVKRKWTKKPPPGKAKIDWSNSLTKGLVAAYFFLGHEENSRPIDLANGFVTTSTPAAYSAIEYDGNGSYWHTDANEGILLDALDLSNGFTIIGELKHDTNTTDQALICAENYSRVQIWRDEFASGDRYGMYIVNSAGTDTPVYSVEKSALDTWYKIGVTTNATTSSSGTRSLYVDGKFEGSSTGNLHADFASMPLAIGVNLNGPVVSPGKQLDGSVRFLLVFDQPKLKDEIKTLSDNPEQIFKPQTIYIPQAAGGGGTTIIQLAGGGGLAGPSGLAGPGGLAG